MRTHRDRTEAGHRCITRRHAFLALAACLSALGCEQGPKGSGQGPPRTSGSSAALPGGRLVFQSRIEGRWQIFLLDVRTGVRTRLSRSDADDGYPVLSPQGDWIAFESNRDGTPAIHRMRPDGSSEERLTRGEGACRSPAWAPDARTLAYDRTRGGREGIAVLDLATGRERRVAGGLWRSALPVWSPDGSRIAFTRNQLGWQVFVMGADGSGVRKLTSRGGNCRPDWSPDGRRIAYVSDAADRKGDIWTMDPDGGNPQRLTQDDTTYDYDPAWSPDGSWIVYHRTSDKQRGPWAIWAIPAAGGEPVRISPEGADDRFPDWAP